MANNEFLIKEDDIVAFWGDSITDCSPEIQYRYTEAVENYVLTRHPDWNTKFCNLGWGGDVAGNIERARRDLPHVKPTLVTIMLGMNDGEYMPFDQERASTYVKNISVLVDFIKRDLGARVIIIGPTIYEYSTRPEWDVIERHSEPIDFGFYPEALKRMSAMLGDWAGREGIPFIDLTTFFAKIMNDLENIEGRSNLTLEGIHPNDDGNAVMAVGVLKGLGAQDEVALLEIDSAAGWVIESKHCSISNLALRRGCLTFDRLDQRIRLPLNPEGKRVDDFMKSNILLNRDILKICRIEPGEYRLTIDGLDVAILPSTELERGINLSDFETPMSIISDQIFEATRRKARAFFIRWRTILLPNPVWPNELVPLNEDADTSKIDKELSDLYRLQHSLNRPRLHRYTIQKVR